MNTFDVYVPSYGRAAALKTHKVFPDAIIVCPESQVDEYKKYNPDLQYMVCPDSIEGNMARKRNWIKDHAKKDWFVVVDDDLDYIGGYEHHKEIKLTTEQIMQLCHNMFVMCEDIGTVLWGVNLQRGTLLYKEYQPFSTLSVVLGPLTGHIKSDLRYDETLPLKEDYDYSLQVLHKYHCILRFNKYFYFVGHMTGQTGGCVSFRRMDIEESQNKLLQRKWGSSVVKFDMSKDIDPRIKVPLSGV